MRHCRPRLRRGSPDGREPQPRAQPGARASAGLLGQPLGVLGGPAGRRCAGGPSPPVLAARAERGARAPDSRRGAAAARQGRPGLGQLHTPPIRTVD